MKQAVDLLVERLDGLAPQAALVLGSGLGSLAGEVEDAVRIPYAALPGFPASGVTGHAGEVVAGRLGGAPVLMLSGRAHYYEHGDAAAMRPALETLAGIGITRLLLTNAAGSVDPRPPYIRLKGIDRVPKDELPILRRGRCRLWSKAETGEIGRR